MKKIEKLEKNLEAIKSQVDKVSFERKDTSYRRAGGYFGTNHAYLDDVIVINQIARTKHLNTYICVNQQHKELAEKLAEAKKLLNIEQKRQAKLAQNKWVKDSIDVARKIVQADIENGTIHTNYGKIFMVGNKHIYYAHPHYGHSDYNKWRAMPNTSKHRKVAEELNQLIEAAKNNLLSQQQTSF